MTTETPAAPRANGEPSVVDGVLQHLSVSQVKDFALCRRVWWLQKVARLQKKASKGQQFGSDSHTQLEHYLQTGEDVLGEVPASGLHLLPEPGEGFLVEQPLEAPPLTAALVPFKGFIDLLNLRRADEGVIRITDHKFTSDIDKWAAKPSDLATTRHEHGIQMVGYARWTSARYPWAKRLELEHLYYQTRGAKRAESRLVEVPAGDFAEEWARVETLALEMKAAARAESLDDVKPTWTACDKYGGCSFRTQCLAAQQKKGTPAVSLLSRLQKPAAPVAPSSPPAVLPPDAPASDPAKASIAPAPVQQTLETAAPAQKPLARKKPAPKAPEPELPAPPAAAPAKMEDKPVAAPLQGIRLFVDCLPNEPHGNLASYLAGMKTRLEAEYAVADIRCAPNDSPLAYSKWRGILAANVRATPPAPGTYVVVGSRSSELVQVLVETLEPLCAQGDYVRGVQ